MSKTLRTIYNKLPSILKPAARKFASKIHIFSTVDLASGDPDYSPPLQALEKAIEALKNGLHYTNPDGMLELREKISKMIEEENGFQYDQKKEILITYGASEALYLIFRTLLKENSEVLLPSPHFPHYRDQICEIGGKIVTYPFKPNVPFNEILSYIDKQVTEDTCFILINSPHNPTGRVLSRREVEALAEFIEEKNMYVIWDEVYEKIIFEGKHYTLANIPGVKHRVIFVNSFSKTYGMTGWRIGFLYGPSNLIDPIRKLHRALTFSLNPISQIVALAALEADRNYHESILKILRERREVIANKLKTIENLEYWKPQGTFFFFPKLNLDDITDEEFADMLLRKRVKVRPGSIFDGKGHIRISFARANLKNIEKAMKIIRDVIDEIVRKH